MESTPRRAKKRRSSADSLLNTSNYDAFADRPEFSPDLCIDDKKVIPLLTPQRSVRGNSSRNFRKSCDVNFSQSDLPSPLTPRRCDRDTSFCSPLSKRRKQWSSEKLLPATPSPLGSTCNDVNCTPSSNSVERYKAILEGKKVLDEILRRSKEKARLVSSTGSILTPNSPKVSSVTRLFPEETPRKEPAAQSDSCASFRYIDYSDCPQTREGASECTPNTSLNSGTSDNLEIFDDLPPTPPLSSFILRDVVAYVEVRTSVDKEAKGVKEQLQLLGAVVAKTFNKKVTHVVFMNGKLSTYKKAVERKVPLVSVLWIEECKKRQRQVSATAFPSCDIEKFESPLFEAKPRTHICPRWADLMRKLRNRKRKEKKKPVQNVQVQESREPAEEIFRSTEICPKWAKEAANGNGLVQALISVAKFSEQEFKEIVNKEVTDEEISASPLPVRLLYKLMSPKNDGESDTPCNKDTSNQLQTVVNTNENAELINKSNYELTSGDTGLHGNGKINTKLSHSADFSVLTCKRNSLGENKEPCQLPNLNSDASSACSKIIAPKRLILTIDETANKNERSLDSQMNPADIVGTQSNSLGRKCSKRKLSSLAQKSTILTPTDDEPSVGLKQNPYISEKHLNRTNQRRVSSRHCREEFHGSVALPQRSMVSYTRRKLRTSFESVSIQRRRSQRIAMRSQSNSTYNHLPTVVCTGLHSENHQQSQMNEEL